jgi:hypothetical protein
MVVCQRDLSNSFRPMPRRSATDSQSVRLSVKIFRRVALAGTGVGPRNFFTGTQTRYLRLCKKLNTRIKNQVIEAITTLAVTVRSD